MLLTVAILALDVLKPPDPTGPSFDCAQASAVVPTVICGDVKLSALDRETATRYAAWLNLHPDDKEAPKHQSSFIARRDACASAAAPKACITQAYQQRLVALKIAAGQVPLTATATYVCTTQAATPVVASYYHSEPAAVLIDYQGSTVLALAAPAASGARYTGEGVELWEHQGTAAFTWRGREFTCPRTQISHSAGSAPGSGSAHP